MPRSVFTPLMVCLTLAGCAPKVLIPEGTPVSNLLLSTAGPEGQIEQVNLDNTSYGAPFLSFDIPAGPHTLSLRFKVTAADRCDFGANLCPGTVVRGLCSGPFHPRPNESYRILLDAGQGLVTATVRVRRGPGVYIGQDEDIVAALMCETMTKETERDTSALFTW